MEGGAANVKLIQVSKVKLMQMLKENPSHYRVGATTQDDIRERIWRYDPIYSNATVYYAKTAGPACLCAWEDEALGLLPPIHLHNNQRKSNIPPGSKGSLYIIDTTNMSFDITQDMVLSSSPIVADSEQDDDHGYACVDPLEIFGTGVHGAPEVEIGSTTYEEADLSISYENLSAPVTKRKIKHHSGPIPDSYISNQRRRQQAYCKRSKTLFEMGKRLNSMCGAQVLIKIKSEKGKTKSLSLPTQTTYRTVTTQVGSSLVQPSAAPKTVEGTPKKKQPVQTQSSQKTISMLPGKQARVLSPIIKNAKNKCHFCRIIYESAADKSFKKKHGRCKATWLGCDADGCDVWAHASCANITVKKLKSAKTIPFLCPEHL